MIVYLVEIRHPEYNEQYITASYERIRKELKEAADKQDTGIVVTRYKVEDLKQCYKEIKMKNLKQEENA